ncbi:MAG TPA: GTP cyclohydrolase I FolE2 [Microlunatus sp.]
MGLPDLQDQRDRRGVRLDAVGVAGVRYPVRFDDGDTSGHGVAEIDITVALGAQRRGTHMSRMIEIIHDQLQVVDPRGFPQLLKAAAYRLDVEAVKLQVAMPLSFTVVAPESQRESYETCDVAIAGSLHAGVTDVVTTLSTQVMSLCPCSKAISDYGAHNQRSVVRLSAEGSGDDSYPLPVRAAFDLIRSTGSSPVYPIIKRIDERNLTMHAHDHPAFVEDMARDLSLGCRSRGVGHEIQVRNLESIHSHDAIATVAWKTP